jgi:GH25 family lysozyme M1 (1,4-beta-N-acetylmuramidase)
MLYIKKLIVIIFLFLILILPSSISSNQLSFNHINGIDVSHWQGTIDWEQVMNANVQFAFCKATEGTGFLDPNFSYNMIQAKNAGINIGPYHFATPQLNDAIEEAEYFSSIIEPYIAGGYLLPVLDLEQGSELGQAALSTWVHDWMSTVEYNLGIRPLIYVNSNYANNFLDPSINIYDLWIAHWTYNPNSSPNTGIWNNWYFWQYSNQGNIPGISGYVDLDVFNGNESDLQPFIIPIEDSIDVNQYQFDRGFPVRHAVDGDWGAAQHFIPTEEIISKIQIYMRKFGTPEFNLTIELRENSVIGPVLDTVIIQPEDLQSSWNWLNLDFNDTPATSGMQYFIVCPPAPSGVTTSFGYEWGYAFGNQYDDGSFWFTRDGGNLWRDLPTIYEFTFRTFSY